MKKIRQAAALVLVTGSVVIAAAHPRHEVREKCNREWQKAFRNEDGVRKNLSANTTTAGDLLVFHFIKQ